MLNQIVLVGRLNKEVSLEENGKYATIILAVPRNFKNENGEYDTDYINCVLYGNIAKTTKEYCEKGDLIGIKGRVQSKDDGKMEIVAEKVTFLSTNKENK